MDEEVLMVGARPLAYLTSPPKAMLYEIWKKKLAALAVLFPRLRIQSSTTPMLIFIVYVMK